MRQTSDAARETLAARLTERRGEQIASTICTASSGVDTLDGVTATWIAVPAHRLRRARSIHSVHRDQRPAHHITKPNGPLSMTHYTAWLARGDKHAAATRYRPGFTVLELLFALALGLMVVGIIMTFLHRQQRFYRGLDAPHRRTRTPHRRHRLTCNRSSRNISTRRHHSHRQRHCHRPVHEHRNIHRLHHLGEPRHTPPRHYHLRHVIHELHHCP